MYSFRSIDRHMQVYLSLSISLSLSIGLSLSLEIGAIRNAFFVKLADVRINLQKQINNMWISDTPSWYFGILSSWRGLKINHYSDASMGVR